MENVLEGRKPVARRLIEGLLHGSERHNDVKQGSVMGWRRRMVSRDEITRLHDQLYMGSGQVLV
jgi:hypothetical protein